VLRAEATAALAEARIAGFQDAVMVKVAPKRDAIAASDRYLLDKAEALAEAHDVRGLESLRIAWIDASGGTRRSSPTLTAIDEYLDAARRVQLAIDRQHLLGSAPQR
jgi:hypothetical protein